MSTPTCPSCSTSMRPVPMSAVFACGNDDCSEFAEPKTRSQIDNEIENAGVRQFERHVSDGHAADTDRRAVRDAGRGHLLRD